MYSIIEEIPNKIYQTEIAKNDSETDTQLESAEVFNIQSNDDSKYVEGEYFLKVSNCMYNVFHKGRNNNTM